MENKKVELLAPAGDTDCFRAAINAGADAVYLGLQKFGARAYAGNFTKDELISSLDTAHILKRRIYLTVNTLFKDEETDELYDLLYDAYFSGLDGVIVQDVGVMSYINRQFPDLPIHVSTQAGITTADGANYLKRFGVKRIVPARELNLSEIRRLKEGSGLEIECFIHGSLCYSYSGKCLLSSFIGGRSGNRGKCAQPCRLPYDKKYPLSMKDLCTIDIIPELIDAGISSFKIEGRMKSADYVYGVTSIYRKYIDRYYEGSKYTVSDEDRRNLISVYTRSGNCKGYYFCHNDRNMITPDSPSYSTSEVTDPNTSFTDESKAAIRISCRITKNSPAVITVSNDMGSVTVTTSVTAETAQNRPLTVDEVAKQLEKTGGTLYSVSDIEISLDENLFIPKSGLNAIRREGLEAFGSKICGKHNRAHVEKVRPIRTALASDTVCEPAVNVSILSEEQLLIALESPADQVTIPMDLFERLFVDAGRNTSPKKIYISLPYVIREENRSVGRKRIEGFINKISRMDFVEGLYVQNHESAEILDTLGYSGIIAADIYMYAYNNEAYHLYKNNRIDRTCVPVELNLKELKKRGITGEELIIYGRLPVMISANCICNTEHGCNRRKEGNTLYITDRKGARLYAFCDCNSCTNVIYNSEILSISDERSVFEAVRPSVVRLAFTDENAKQMADVLSKYFATRQPGGFSSDKIIDRYTRGHIKRGVD